MRVAVYNTNREVLEGLRVEWGGTLACGFPKNPKWKPGHELIWTNAAAGNLVQSLAPFLRVKAEIAATLLEFVQHLKHGRRERDSQGRLLPLTSEELEVREAFHRRAKTLNRRGPTGVVSQPPENKSRHEGDTQAVSPQYLAGFIDGEGSLMIAKYRDRKNQKTRYRARASVSNTDRTVLESVRRTYGGILANQPARKAGWKHAYQLIWTGGMIEHLLLLVGPHLRLKGKQANVVAQFIRHQRETRPGRGGRSLAPLSAEVEAFREALFSKMRALNARGLPVAGARATQTFDGSKTPRTQDSLGDAGLVPVG